MERVNVISTNIKSVGYDEKIKTLEVEFKHGSVYQYSKVPKEIYVSLMNATSKGKYFYRFIRDNYPTIKVR